MIKSGNPALLCVFLILCRFASIMGQLEPYVYVIYHSDEQEGQDQCGGALTMIGFVSGDDQAVYGGRSTRDVCADETICVMDFESEQCMALEQTNVAQVTFSVSEVDGLIHQCDTSNTDGEPKCSILDQCYKSSQVPHCHFRVARTSEIIAMPQLITNKNPEYLDEQSYLMMYSDASCENFEGMQGLAVGTTELAVTSDDMACQEAIACMMNAEGAGCKNNGGPENMFNMTVKVVNGTAYECNTTTDDATTIKSELDGCQPKSPDTCEPSSLYPSCHYKLVSASTLVSDPAKFLNSPPTPSPTSAPTTTSMTSSGGAMGVAMGAVVVVFAVALH